MTKKEHGSLAFSSKYVDLHSDSKSDKAQEGDRKSINSLGERQLTDENLGIPSKVRTLGLILFFQIPAMLNVFVTSAVQSNVDFLIPAYSGS